MITDNFLFTSESVGEGHPDKVCDQISDAVLDAILAKDPKARVACETYATMGLIIVGGEITTKTYVDIHKITRDVVRKIGYDHAKYGMDYKTCSILNAINTQSPDIAQGVDRGGAGDQGMMIGFACRETKELMPLPIMLSHRLVRRVAEVRKSKTLPYLGPDCKSQVTVQYENGKPKFVADVVLACQHTEDILNRKGDRITDKARKEIIKVIAEPILKKYITSKTKFFVNETGKFVFGGPQSDTGMTGRKIIVDTYGGMVSHGGGAFSGKDPSKVDRSAAYMARYVAKNVVASGLADECLIQLAYAIGVSEPVSLMVKCEGTNRIPEADIAKAIRKTFDLTPRGIVRELDLLKPRYSKSSCYGHFGRHEKEFTWERTDKAERLKKFL